MIIKLITLLLSLAKVVELILNNVARHRQTSEDRKAVLALRDYRERLERAMQAKARIRDEGRHSVPLGPDNNGVPDDGFRRD